MPTYTARIIIEDDDNDMNTEIITRGHASVNTALVVVGGLFAVRYAASHAVITVTITPVFNEEGL